MPDTPPAPADPARRLRCPRCTEPMTALALSSHRHAPVTVDHCGGCRLVWFDALESVQLDALGWVRLLRTMESGLARPLALAQVARPACPVCQVGLKVVRNRTRYGRFAAQECPQGHGHLSGHASLLAERGLVRPLGLPERRALAAERHPLHCLNCGGPAAADDEHCSWCGTVLSVIDLPRLAHSLQVRDAAMAPSPGERGRHASWPCRGCGAALDPGRDAECPACGHPVVALQLPDIDPLLDEAEAALAAHAAAVARVRERFPSGRRAPAADAPAAVITSREVRPWGWPGWLPLVALATLAALLFGSLLGVARPSPEAVLALRTGPAPATLWPWVAEHARLAPGDTRDQQRLRLNVLDLHLRQLTGGRWLPEGRLAELAQRQVDPGWLREKWQVALQRWLTTLPASSTDPLPAAAASAGERFVADAPAAWVEAGERRVGLWTPRVRNEGPLALPVAALHLRIPTSGGGGLPWRCEPTAPEAVPALAPGAEVQLLCRTHVVPGRQSSTWAEAMQVLREGSLAPEWQPGDGRRSVDLTLLDSVAQGFVERAARGGSAGGLPWGTRWHGLTGGRLLATLAALALLDFVGFCVLARGLGERRAMALLLLAALPVFVLLGRGEGAATPLLVGAGVAAVAVAVFGYRFAFRLYRDWVRLRLGRG